MLREDGGHQKPEGFGSRRHPSVSGSPNPLNLRCSPTRFHQILERTKKRKFEIEA
jgi:hypothetical protein